MITFAPWRPAREHRESYTEDRVAAAVARAEGVAASGLVATVETIARLWEAAFSAGQSTVLAPWQLAMIGRSLVLRGESVWWRSGRSGLLPVASHDVRGRSAAPARWRYQLTMPAPDTSLTREAPSDRVLHARIGCTAARPWAGCSPLASSDATRAALEQVERSLGDEHSGPVGTVIGVPDPSTQAEVADTIAVLKGRAILVEQGDLGLAGEQAARQQWDPKRIGPEPSQTTTLARDQLERSLLAAAGVPGELVTVQSGTDTRESWRRFLYATVAPAAGVVSAELRRLGLESEINFDELRASDVSGRARAYGVLVNAGMDAAEASRIAGFAPS